MRIVARHSFMSLLIGAIDAGDSWTNPKRPCRRPPRRAATRRPACGLKRAMGGTDDAPYPRSSFGRSSPLPRKSRAPREALPPPVPFRRRVGGFSDRGLRLTNHRRALPEDGLYGGRLSLTTR
jgi:hypothetical protein